jgi:NADPH2:quinone reductase
MTEVYRSAVLRVPLEQAWNVLRDFNGHESWHPAVAESRIEDGASGDRIGAVRDFRLRDGSRIREQLLALSDVETSFTYCILEAPVPLRNYVATVRLRAATMENACLWEWRARFDPPAAEKQRLSQFIAQDIFEAGFRSVASLLEQGRSFAPRAVEMAAPMASSSAAVEAPAVVVTRYGGPEVLEMRTVRVAAPGPGEVRIRQTAIGVNFIDVYCRSGSFDLVQPPGVLGMEAVGLVESVGPGVAALRAGDRVGYACAPPGAYAATRTMSADLVFPLPEFLGDEEAAALLLKGISASFLLHDVYAVKRGDVILVHAAAGGVGLLLCRWASALGARVIGATSSAAKAERARQAGCAHVIVYAEEDFAEAALRLTDGRGVSAVYDAVGKDTFQNSVRALAPRGHLVSFGQASGNVGSHSIDSFASKSLTLSRPNYAHYTDTPEKLKIQTDRLFAALQTGAVIAERPTLYRLADARSAHADLESRRTTGALVLTP